MMAHFLSLLVLAALACLVAASAAIAALMRGVGAIDRPNSRSSHAIPVPKGGGMGLFLPYAVLMLAVALRQEDWPVWLYLAGVALIALYCLADDYRDLPPLLKLAVQIVSCLVVIAAVCADSRVDSVLPAPLFWAGAAFLFLFAVFTVNAVNFVDGINGLTAGVTAAACLCFALVGEFLPGHFLLFTPAVVMALALGFLPLNFPRATLFLGDVGSQFCGIVLAAIVAGRAMAAGSATEFLAPILPLHGVLFDVAYTLLRRWRAGERLFAAHRGHLYQLATRSGVGRVPVTLLQWLFTLAGGAAYAASLAYGWAGFVTAVAVLGAGQLAWLLFVARRAQRAGIASAVLLWRLDRGVEPVGEGRIDRPLADELRRHVGDE